MVGLRASKPYTLDVVLSRLHVIHPLFTPDADVEIVALCRPSLLQGCSVHLSLSSQIITQFGWCAAMLNREIPPADASFHVNPLTPNDPYMGRTAPLTYRRYILYIYSTNIRTEYFKNAAHSPFFSLFKMPFIS